MKAGRLAVCFITHDDAYYLAESITSFAHGGEVFVFVSRVPWHDQPGDWRKALGVGRQAGAEGVVGEWRSELEHRQAACEYLLGKGFTHALIPDGDEITEPALLTNLVKIAKAGLADRVYVHWDTYWKSPEYVIRPREGFTPLAMVDLRVAKPVGLRNFEGGRPLLLGPEHGIVHHLSYVGPDERIQRKIATWGHTNEVIPGWYENVWLGWDSNKLLRDLHPTHPQAYGFAERIAVPEALRGAMARHKQLEGEAVIGDPTGSRLQPQLSTSVVIPLHGGEQDIRQCLHSLTHCVDLIREVVVVDNASPDGAADGAEAFASTVARQASDPKSKADPSGMTASNPSSLEMTAADPSAGGTAPPALPLRIIRNDTNRGFGTACNQGFAVTTGEVVLFLNSDTIVPRIGLLRLLEALDQSGSIAAAGPYTNYSGHGQQIAPTYTSLDNLNLFAEDFANRPAEDVETDMLVGFCLAVKRNVLNELCESNSTSNSNSNSAFANVKSGSLRDDGASSSSSSSCSSSAVQPDSPLPFDERFGLGTFEDNDLCYRMRRAGYRLVIAARSFVHHHGSRTLARIGNVEALLRGNEQLYRAKWQEDLESGHASHLSGLSGERITFSADKHPDRRMKRMREKARRANISLCMIAKNEERVLGAALQSAKPFFREMIVVDTGSTDRTKEIALAAGAKVYDFPWVEDFSAARNESLLHATGRWISWLDADDTLPWSSGEAILDAALNAPGNVAGFIVPVRFVDEGSLGTQVDHVKLFRNRKGLAFERRIHEQILPSLRASGGQIVRCGAVVLHTGYDTSPEGQERKRERDVRILALEYHDRKDDPFTLFCIGMTQHFGRKHRSAARWLRRCLRFSTTDESHVRKVYPMLAVSLRELEQDDEAIRVLEEGLAAYPDDPELHFQSGLMMTGRGELERARDHYLRVLGTDISDHFSSVDMGILSFKTFHNLAGVYATMGDYREAKGWWTRAIETAPEFLPSAFNLFDAAVKADDLVGARLALDAVLAAEGPSENWAKMGARYASEAGGPENVEAYLRRAVHRFERSVGPRLVLSRHLLENGREGDAVEHLRMLAQAGVAEACYFLGVMAMRRGDAANALPWMERAQELNPTHAETEQQVAILRGALGLDESSMPFEKALAAVAADVDLEPGELLAYSHEDAVGGYNLPGLENGHPLWPGGSVWEAEGQVLYSLVRALKPQVIVEVGSFIGCSTSHLASACLRNGSGKVYAVDPASDFSRVDPALLPYIVPVKEDARAWTPPEEADFVFEDGTHEPGFTRSVLDHLLPSTRPGAVVVTHDYAHATHGPHVSAEFDEALGSHARSVLIKPSNCGLGIAICNRPATSVA